jgi:UDP-N-acetylmuramate dehydrogenase
VVLSVTFRLAADPLSAPVRYGELSRLLGAGDEGRVPLADARAAVLQLRRGKGMVLDAADPDTRSAGSFFTNPVVPAAQFEDVAARYAARADGDAPAGDAARAGGDAAAVPHWAEGDGMVKLSAAWLIEQAGFSKGYPGPAAGARISTKHTLALTSPGGGSTADLVRLARQVRDGVLAAFGVRLTNEPTLVGTEL